MNEKDAWKNFVNSGSVNDYLRYASERSRTNADSEEEDEFQYGRSCDKRADDKRRKQGNNRSDKG